jgi:hypothetical protein
MQPNLFNRDISNVYSDECWWGGWGSNPRPADYEKYGPALRTRYLHGYHGVVPLMALIAPFARATRSTNRSTPRQGDHRMPVTERYRRQGLDMPGLRRRVAERGPMPGLEQSGNIADT